MNKKDGNYQNIVNKTALSHGSASSAHIGLDHQGHHGVNQLQGSKNFQRNMKNQPGPNNKYSDDEGFMRGARIAEKIQEYYHSNSNIVPGTGSSHTSNFVGNNQNQNSKHSSLYTNSHVVNKTDGPKVMKQFVHYSGNQKHIKNHKGQIFQMGHHRADNARATHTSHGNAGTRGNYKQQISGPAVRENIHQTHEQVANALKGRASSSYGSLQSRTNNAVGSSGSIVKQYPQKGNGNLNKSGISATSGI